MWVKIQEQSGSLSGASGRKNHGHREIHAAFRRLVDALPGLAGKENPRMSGPVRIATVAPHVGLINLHQVAGVCGGGEGGGGSRQVISITVHHAADGRGGNVAAT
ncbi:hypothetical protein EYF80_040166 [Liparis tanakae]|uniref:Uncharacterized protein n=1 Tax=Liparis tanakae TaxID=230148 RepID=A0A4Z2G7T7_9TELE|nr:hypothetical protein EYF80_040166 [Liparis tanakae]